ncbi:hypothetical protein ABXV18_24755 [Vibrio owensii]|uniref:hypothetical protein n=1 Tax=Vibrio owensii TaxID=696485 RepID=UPI003393EAEF
MSVVHKERMANAKKLKWETRKLKLESFALVLKTTFWVYAVAKVFNVWGKEQKWLELLEKIVSSL